MKATTLFCSLCIVFAFISCTAQNETKNVEQINKETVSIPEKNSK